MQSLVENRLSQALLYGPTKQKLSLKKGSSGMDMIRATGLNPIIETQEDKRFSSVGVAMTSDNEDEDENLLGEDGPAKEEKQELFGEATFGKDYKV